MQFTPNTNTRLPSLSVPGIYPYVRYTQFRDGSWERQDETPGNEGHSKGHKLGSFTEVDPTAGHKNFVQGQKFSYHQTGETSTTELNSHNKTGGGTVSQVTGDSHTENAGAHYHAIGNDNITISAGIHFQHSTGGNQQTSSGDQVTDHNDGNQHHYIDGDKITFLGGTEYTQVGAEYGLYTPNGNMDFMASGNIQFTCQNFTINAAMSLTINTPYGLITVNNQGIEIRANVGNVCINATSGAVITNGASLGTMLQGGGITSPPMTVIG